MYKHVLRRLITVKKYPNITESKKFLSCGACLKYPRYPPQKPSPGIASKYEIISEENSPVIEDTANESSYQYRDNNYPILSDEFDGINLERGKNGVFDIEDLVDLVHRENSRDVFVASVPREINYVEYICVVSARSKRHILALAEFVRKVYKRKCNKSDHIPRLEGKNSDEWIALDLGNIALHIFSEKARKVYDLETLWSVGPEYDDQISKTSDVVDILENYSSYLKDLKPLA